MDTGFSYFGNGSGNGDGSGSGSGNGSGNGNGSGSGSGTNFLTAISGGPMAGAAMAAITKVRAVKRMVFMIEVRAVVGNEDWKGSSKVAITANNGNTGCGRGGT